ncbi:MAG TPA: hypothetical protein VN282_02410 [Pyrinomonadaceae bacterium]|nr:hypothetical protein [Pyrinomonadaceae bacterium]
MKRRFILTGLMGMLFLLTAGAGVAGAQDFSGRWVMDKSRSTDFAPATDVSMTIVHKGQKVTVSHRIVTPQGVLTPKETYVLNGATQEVMMDGPNNSRAKGKRTARKIDGGFETHDEATFNIERIPQPVAIATSRKWQLSPDGRTLTLEISRVSKVRSHSSRRVFTKQ